MNRLWVRLALAFVLVTFVSVGAAALIANWTVGTQFRQYVARQQALEQSGIVEELAAYYRQTGSWSGVAQVLGGAQMPGMGRGRGGMMGRGGFGVRLADSGGGVVYDDHGAIGGTLSADERAAALPVVVDGATVGYLLAGGGMMEGMMAPAEQSYLEQLRGTLLIAALVAGVFGIVLGLLVSRTVAAPLSGLADSARAFAAGDRLRRAPVTGAREVADAGRAFNEMADALQRSEETRRNLVADIAHELRTPLTVVQGNLRAMLDGVYPLERAEIATLYDETRLLSRLVDDLREVALAEAGQLPLNLQTVDTGEQLRAALNRFAAAADMQGIALRADLPSQLPSVRADPDRFAQVLQNLMANALRHTPAGGTITLSAEPLAASSAGSGQGLVRISVRDSGEGIAPQDLPHVFDRFYRGDKARTRMGVPSAGAGQILTGSPSGSGLGLAIAKSLVEAMGGAIGAESTRGAGSTFWFTLPG